MPPELSRLFKPERLSQLNRVTLKDDPCMLQDMMCEYLVKAHGYLAHPTSPATIEAVASHLGLWPGELNKVFSPYTGRLSLNEDGGKFLQAIYATGTQHARDRLDTIPRELMSSDFQALARATARQPDEPGQNLRDVALAHGLSTVAAHDLFDVAGALRTNLTITPPKLPAPRELLGLFTAETRRALAANSGDPAMLPDLMCQSLFRFHTSMANVGLHAATPENFEAIALSFGLQPQALSKVVSPLTGALLLNEDGGKLLAAVYGTERQHSAQFLDALPRTLMLSDLQALSRTTARVLMPGESLRDAAVANGLSAVAATDLFSADGSLRPDRRMAQPAQHVQASTSTQQALLSTEVAKLFRPNTYSALRRTMESSPSSAKADAIYRPLIDAQKRMMGQGLKANILTVSDDLGLEKKELSQVFHTSGRLLLTEESGKLLAAIKVTASEEVQAEFESMAREIPQKDLNALIAALQAPLVPGRTQRDEALQHGVNTVVVDHLFDNQGDLLAERVHGLRKAQSNKLPRMQPRAPLPAQPQQAARPAAPQARAARLARGPVGAPQTGRRRPAEPAEQPDRAARARYHSPVRTPPVLHPLPASPLGLPAGEDFAANLSDTADVLVEFEAMNVAEVLTYLPDLPAAEAGANAFDLDLPSLSEADLFAAPMTPGDAQAIDPLQAFLMDFDAER